MLSRGPAGAWPTAETEVAAVIGSPVRHSLSPLLHNAAFEAMGLDWVYTAFEVPEGSAPDAVRGMLALGIRGLSVTMPHKAAAARACDSLSLTAQRLGVVNTVTNVGGKAVGDSTDGAGLVDSLEDEGVDLKDRRCLVLGTGGAARAAALAFAESAASSVAIIGRAPLAASETASLAGEVGSVVMPDAIARAVLEAEIIFNATPVGMQGKPEEAAIPFGIKPEWLDPSSVVVDAVYHPPVTPLLAAARGRGARAVGGVGMLVHQAGRQVRLWTGAEPPLAAMSAAAIAAVAQRSSAASA